MSGTRVVASALPSTRSIARPLVVYVDQEGNDLFFMQIAFEQARLGRGLVTFQKAQTASEFLQAWGAALDPGAGGRCVVILEPCRGDTVRILDVLAANEFLRRIPVVCLSDCRTTGCPRCGNERFSARMEKPPDGDFRGVAREVVERWLQPGTGGESCGLSGPRPRADGLGDSPVRRNSE